MKKVILIAIVAFVIVVACKSGTDTKANVLTINLEPKSGSTVTGTATFTEKNGVVSFEAKMTGLKPGVHAIHIHEKADCSAADATSTGGHWNPTFKKHGKWSDAEHHKGDIGNFTADANGNGTITLKTDEWCIGCGDETKDILNKGLIVHANPDDFVTQPTGNAGGRVACSGIIK
ncbi:superoxide dismutase family protein [Flavobacterium aquatile]|uniref:Superoxide dismutase [Cu-Zn] n=1 Tax=Flavobacterium aquatile LMG 4008 = ATCC 11947 TaxID=1453498 RepID=A0A095SSP4_9FLAO|nr:superoxide dismutase family protein [Flavobacterium aquatile]KGD67651.1 superoxide dismutase [Flavobacterium aquatile LMG 4008 = ATCC 11947]OXA67518.1 superoxide dismutase [Flavobacterium aquatile] [Flavobacterium aquatile LMG 4008 = ATCC 11947]GEC79146.1 superoxide dismutase [Cu-Zn] [Flavobacterium aquatile]